MERTPVERETCNVEFPVVLESQQDDDGFHARAIAFGVTGPVVTRASLDGAKTAAINQLWRMQNLWRAQQMDIEKGYVAPCGMLF